MVFSKVIERIYYGLNTDTAAHQIAEILELLSHLINSTITSNLFAQHFAQLLQQTLPAIDLNDSTKTYSALKFHLPLYASFHCRLNEIEGYQILCEPSLNPVLRTSHCSSRSH